MSQAAPEGPHRSGKESSEGSSFIRAIEWKIAWRHVRRGGSEERPAWVRISLLGAIYMTLVAVGFLLYAAAGVEAVEGQQLFSGAELTPSQRWFGVFGALGLFMGVLWLIVSLLASFFNLLATIITVSVLVGCMALVVVLSLMTGLESDLRDKILNQKAHVLVSAQDGNRFADYEALAAALREAPGVVGASPFVEGEVMAKSGMNRQGGILRGVDPERIVEVSNLGEIVERGEFEWLAEPAAIEDEDPFADDEGTPWRLRHLEGERPPDATPLRKPRAWAIGGPLALLLLTLLIGLRRVSWRVWLPPAVVVAAGTLAVVSLSPQDPQLPGGLPGELPAALDEAQGGDDPMLERLKPKPMPGPDELPTPAGTDAPPKASPGSSSKSSSKSIVGPQGLGTITVDSADEEELGEDAAGFGSAVGIVRELGPAGAPPTEPFVPELPTVRDTRIQPIDLGLDPRPPSDEEQGWEDPLVELGLGAPPSETPKTLPPPRPSHQPAAGEDPDEGEDGDDGGWEDPIEELGLDPSPDPDPNPAPDPSPSPSADPPAKKLKGIPDAILIGNELAMELAVRVGSRVQLITPIGRMTPAGRVPGMLATKVGGIFKSGNYEFDRKNIYAPLPVVQRFLRTGDRVSGIEIKLADVEQLESGKAAVLQVLESSGRSAELRAETWQELNKNLFSAMLLEKIAMGVTLLMVVLVASFGILASNLMSVLEKAKEIAILKAMGAPDVQIQRVFVAEGLCVGLVGAALGLLVGLALCMGLDRFGFPFDENVYYIEQLPVVVNPLEVLIVGVAALGIIWGSSLYPARVASRMRPVDGLRENDR